MVGGGIPCAAERAKVEGAVCLFMGVDRAELFTNHSHGVPSRGSAARQLAAYLGVAGLKLSQREVAEWLGYARGAAVFKAVSRLCQTYGLPRPAPVDRLVQARAALAAKKEAEAEAWKARVAEHHHSHTRMTVPANPPPVTLASLSDRIVDFLARHDGATTQTLATCLDAKELSVGQSLSWLKHQGQLVNDAPDGCVVRATRWRLPQLERAA